MFSIQFCGAAGTVTGSCHLITLESGKKILLDCGLFQGHQAYVDEWNSRWLFKPSDIDYVILSHAHIDHSGRLPKLVKDGFRGPIYATSGTIDLCEAMLMDSAKIQVKDSEYFNKKRQKRHEEEVEPLYTPEDVEPVLELFKMVNYENWHSIDNEISFLFRDAGHILGSASVTLKIHTKHEGDILLGFTGDVGRPKRPILKDPIPMPECDYLITESTYGGRKHEASPEDVNHLLDVIYETCIRNQGKVIIPAFSVGRTQEIVYMLNNLWNEKRLPKIPVYVDSPLSVNVTGIYAKHPECFDKEVREIMNHDPNPFGFQSLEFITDTQDSKELNTSKEPCIIISASGMAESGRIVHHIKHQIENASSTILIVGYASEHSLAGRLRKKPDFVKIHGQEHRVNARIEIMDSFSAHGDEEELVQFLSSQNKKQLKNIFLVHGEDEALQAFSNRLIHEGFSQTTIPAHGEVITIG